MSCFNNYCYLYLPQPPRAWSRVQNSCSLITDTDNNKLVIDPYTGQVVSKNVLAERIAMLNKGNILQYKANSSNLTKAQRYSKIAKGQWVNRNTTWATQSTRGYTNPNTTSLKRTGDVINIAIDPITGAIIGPTVAPPTCPKPFIPINEGLPSNGGSSDVKEPNIPPLIPPTPGSETFPSIIPVTPVEPIVIQDGGSLICSVQENICTGEIKSTLAQQLCHPTTDSDVPGPIQELCWNDGIQTWYPRQRYVMTNSGNKWPVNAELNSAIKIYPPILTANVVECIINLSWTETNCSQVTYYEIYVNNNLYDRVPSSVNTYSFFENDGNYDIYIRAISNSIGSSIDSEPSNIVRVSITLKGLIIISDLNIKTTTYSQSGNRTIVIESTIQPTFGQSPNIQSNAVFYLTSCFPLKPLNILLVGAGGGGASGYAGYCGGGGGGSGAVTHITNFTPPINTQITLSIGIGGGGRKPGNGGGGNSSGSGGSSTYIYYSSTQIVSSPGTGGLGVGTAVGCAGGGGGNSTKALEPIGPIYNGYGGNSGGGAFLSGGGAATKPCAAGTGYTSNGLQGSSGSSNSNNPIGGNGANSVFPSLSIPLLGTVYFGGSGGGGGILGGNAGNNGLGGFGGNNSSGNPGGTNASTYGAGGGGGGAISTINNVGGNGANGVIIIWF